MFIPGALYRSVKAPGLVHFFAGGDHQVVQAVSDVGPAAVVVDASLAAALPDEGRRTQGSKLCVSGPWTVRLGYEHFSKDLSVTRATYHHRSLTNDQDQTIPLHRAADGQRTSYHQHACAAGKAHIAVYESDLWVGRCAVTSGAACPAKAAAVRIISHIRHL